MPAMRQVQVRALQALRNAFDPFVGRTGSLNAFFGCHLQKVSRQVVGGAD
jgi:hypothetical protein